MFRSYFGYSSYYPSHDSSSDEEEDFAKLRSTAIDPQGIIAMGIVEDALIRCSYSFSAIGLQTGRVAGK